MKKQVRRTIIAGIICSAAVLLPIGAAQASQDTVSAGFGPSQIGCSALFANGQPGNNPDVSSANTDKAFGPYGYQCTKVGVLTVCILYGTIYDTGWVTNGGSFATASCYGQLIGSRHRLWVDNFCKEWALGNNGGQASYTGTC